MIDFKNKNRKKGDCSKSLVDVCAIYFLFIHEEIVYIGSTKNLHGRILQHRYTTDFDEYNYILTTEEEMRELEKHCIREYMPKLNKNDRPLCKTNFQYDKSGKNNKTTNEIFLFLLNSKKEWDAAGLIDADRKYYLRLLKLGSLPHYTVMERRLTEAGYTKLTEAQTVPAEWEDK